MPDSEHVIEHVIEHVERVGMSLLRGRLIPDDPATFRMGVRESKLETASVQVVRASPHRWVRTEEDIAATPERTVVLLVVGEGLCTGQVGGTSFLLRAGDVGVYDSDTVIEAHLPEPFRMLSCVVAAKHLPPYVLDGPPLPHEALPRTALVNSTIAFASALMSDGGAAERTPQLAQALADLYVGILGEMRGVRARAPGASGLRYRIEEHVMAHLAEPGLSPGSIAAALGISLRSVHHAFEDDEVTVARLIRDRRLEAVAAELRERRGAIAMADLAERHGFGSRDQLARSFRQRFGGTMKQYRDAARDGR